MDETKTTTGFILIVRSVTCRSKDNMEPMFYLCTMHIRKTNPEILETHSTRPREQTNKRRFTMLKIKRAALYNFYMNL